MTDRWKSIVAVLIVAVLGWPPNSHVAASPTGSIVLFVVVIGAATSVASRWALAGDVVRRSSGNRHVLLAGRRLTMCGPMVISMDGRRNNSFVSWVTTRRH